MELFSSASLSSISLRALLSSLVRKVHSSFNSSRECGSEEMEASEEKGLL